VQDMVGIGAGAQDGWDAAERAQIDTYIAERTPFLDYVYRRTLADGSVQYLQVSGEPVFDDASRFIGYRGVGRDVTEMAAMFVRAV